MMKIRMKRQQIRTEDLAIMGPVTDMEEKVMRCVRMMGSKVRREAMYLLYAGQKALSTICLCKQKKPGALPNLKVL